MDAILVFLAKSLDKHGTILKSSQLLNALALFPLITSEIFQLTHR